jgi:peptidoglycan/xylan/chitin deacetylase (PgdA/CDA1 family)
MYAVLKSLRNKFIKSIIVSTMVVASGLMVFGTPINAYAATTNTAPAAKVSFTFDDGLQSASTQAAPTLAKYGFSGTDYVITGCVGMTTAPNTCHANTDATYLSWAQVQALQNSSHWEIASHTVTHPYLASFDATDGQPNKLTTAQVTTELVNSKATLAAQGINATDFASPYGDYSPAVLAQVAKYYASMRGFADTGYNAWPNNDYIIRDEQIQAGVTVAQAKAYVDSAIANNQWLVLTFHDIKPVASTDPADYEYSTADLDAIAAYIKSKNVSVVNINAGLVKSDVNLLANNSFNSGIASGWTTNNTSGVTKDTLTNGSYPDPTNSVKFVAGTKDEHLFSPKVAVSASNTYMLKNYLNITKRTSGEVSFYIDEYDTNGNWISGQYKKAETTLFPEELGISYKPTSTNVATASLQVGVTANSGITAYLDNSQWFPLTTVVSTPPAILGEETFDGGLTTDGWTTDSAATITPDGGNNGSPANVVNSVKLTATTTNKHLFSAKMITDSTKTYNFASYVNVKTLTSGEVGFYIDEYDASGNWISGQYKTGARAVGTSTVSFNYTPTNATVKSSSLQVIVVGNSGITAYIDDIKVSQL